MTLVVVVSSQIQEGLFKLRLVSALQEEHGLRVKQLMSLIFTPEKHNYIAKFITVKHCRTLPHSVSKNGNPKDSTSTSYIYINSLIKVFRE